jgi:hypothetical protein
MLAVSVLLLGVTLVCALCLFFATSPERGVLIPKLAGTSVPVAPPPAAVRRPEPKALVPRTVSAAAVLPPEPAARRFAVGGAEGFAVVVAPDGSSRLEAPDGSKVELTTAEPVVATPAAERVIKQVVSRLETPTPGALAGQLLVLDRGVVTVPRGAVITYMGADRVIVHEDDNTSTIYYISGAIEHEVAVPEGGAPR